ncbi:hypothetical protein ABMA27_012424 [Loxostege sticticalis]|uniref:Uncharacterized protein n=1 Tax=Loxostege sticticalis TaxID=481309 RepID=A0ABR3H198_LOXSC
MDNETQKKPKIIQMKYPAPYSQSWAENKTTGVSKKKSKVHNTNRGAAHSQSFANDRSTKKAKRKLPSPKSDNHKPGADPFKRGPWHAAKPRVRGPDPTVPHLKYGLFKPPKKNEDQSQIQVLSQTGQEPKSRTSTPEQSSKRDKKLKANKGQLPEGQPPMFVFRSIDPRYTRQLTLSGPTHVDIRPRATPALFTPALQALGIGDTSRAFQYAMSMRFNERQLRGMGRL